MKPSFRLILHECLMFEESTFLGVVDILELKQSVFLQTARDVLFLSGAYLTDKIHIQVFQQFFLPPFYWENLFSPLIGVNFLVTLS